MNEWERNDPPPGHGESAPAMPGKDRYCWCGRPLTPTPSHVEEGVTFWECPLHGVVDES